MIHRSRSNSSWFFGLFLLAAAEPCLGQCLDWDARFHASGTDVMVDSMSTFDDGSGPALFIGGNFTSVGSDDIGHLAKRIGSSWVSVGGGIDGRVRVLETLDDGSGLALYAGGSFSHAGGSLASCVARWNGTSWKAFNGLNTVRALAVFDDGSGTALYAGGDFVLPPPFPGDLPINGIAKWNGTQWTALGTGMEGSSQPAVYALTVFDDGSGPALYVGGQFNTADMVAAKNIARWNGTSWSAVGTGTNSIVRALRVYDAGAGDALYVGGDFSTAGGISALRLARWDGAWSGLGGITTTSVRTLSVHDDGSGPELYAGGRFTVIEDTNANRIAKWNGSSWTALGAGLDDDVNVIALFDDGSGARIWAGGDFLKSGSVLAAHLARWDGASWSSESDGQGLESDFVSVLGAGDIGSGPRLFAGGEITSAGSVSVTRIAEWNGSSWSPLGAGLSPWYPTALLVHDDGSGPALYVGGPFTTAGGAPASCIARWNGTSWSSLGAGVTGGPVLQVWALASFDDGSGTALYAGGGFTTAGGNAATNIARWNGTSWSALGAGIGGGGFTSVFALEIFDDGSGPALFAAGDFESAGGAPAKFVAKWNGTSWSALGTGMNDAVYDLEVYNSGSGPQLYACGEFSTAGGGSAPGVAKWNGTSWSAVGTGTTAGAKKLATFDYGPATELFMTGAVTIAGGGPVQPISKWNGTSWSHVSASVTTAGGEAMTVFDDGLDGAPDLYVGGTFTLATATTPSLLIAQLHGCAPYNSYCFGDGLDPVVTAQCPCANFGDPGHGCANSNLALGGGHMVATGTVSPNTLLFTCDGIPNNSLATFWRGTTNTAAGSVVHDGIQCLGGTTIRFGTQNAGQIGNPPNTVASGTIGLAPGATRYYQLLYRNPAPGFCPPGTFNFSNGIVVTW